MSEVSLDAGATQPQGENSVNNKRRKFLTIATSVVGAVGIGGAAVPFIAYWQPSERAKAAGADVEVDISGLQMGQLIRVNWRSKPVWVVRRSPELLASLKSAEPYLADPQSDEEQQPDYAKNEHRSINSEYLVLVGTCTHLGCSPKRLTNGDFEQYAEGVSEGFFCPCHGSMFDMAGRVFKGVPAPSNLMVPPHMFVDENTIIIGSDEVTA